jgi:hypothetical protein
MLIKQFNHISNVTSINRNKALVIKLKFSFSLTCCGYHQMKFNWPCEELSSIFSFHKKFSSAKNVYYGKFNKPVTLEDEITVEASKNIIFSDFKYDKDDQEISLIFPEYNTIIADQNSFFKLYLVPYNLSSW